MIIIVKKKFVNKNINKNKSNNSNTNKVRPSLQKKRVHKFNQSIETDKINNKFGECITPEMRDKTYDKSGIVLYPLL